MATLSLVRIDHRLIHGQVMTMWTKEYSVDHILVIDDPLTKDDFLKKIYGLSVPSSIKLEINSVDEAVQRWEKDKLGTGKYLVLMKDPQTALRAWKSGFGIEKLQIGNVEADSNSEIVHRSSRLGKGHLSYLSEMLEGGVEVYIQSLPTEKKVLLKDLISN